MSETVQVTGPSFKSLLLRTTTPNLADAGAPDIEVASGTGILTRRSGQMWLVTAGHVLTGINPITGEVGNRFGAVPKHVQIRLPHTSAFWMHLWQKQPLYDFDGQPRWLQHPRGPLVDVVALPLTESAPIGHANVNEAEWGPWNTEEMIRLELPWALDVPLAPISLDVADELSVVGYPFGITGGAGLAIWTHGWIATELKFDHDDLPMFLLDARTRSGQSGAPVVFFSRSGQFPTGKGIAFGLGDHLLRFMGIYSGRINEQSDLGRVFRADAVLDTLDSGVPPTASTGPEM